MFITCLCACGGRLADAPEEVVTTCTTDDDCADGLSCRAVDPSQRSPNAFQPCPGPPPPVCETRTHCPGGAYCASSFGPPCALSCISDCSNAASNPCDEGTVCRGKACLPPRCDDASHPGCPTGMTCNPALTLDATTSRPEGGYVLTGTDQLPPGAPSQLTQRQSEAARAGCVFLRCDESGAFDCAEDHRCDPLNADPITTGCVGIPCRELGHCSSGEFVCEPKDTRTRSVLRDAHGCVQTHCEEGHACPAFSACNFESPGDGRGCGYLRCDEPGGGCAAGKKCEPEPNASPTDVNGCVLVEMNGTAGSSGAGNAGSSGVSGAGGSANAAGSAGSEAAAGAGGQGAGGASSGVTFGVCRAPD